MSQLYQVRHSFFQFSPPLHSPFLPHQTAHRILCPGLVQPEVRPCRFFLQLADGHFLAGNVKDAPAPLKF
jgi:hypothetical protein